MSNKFEERQKFWCHSTCGARISQPVAGHLYFSTLYHDFKSLYDSHCLVCGESINKKQKLALVKSHYNTEIERRTFCILDSSGPKPTTSAPFKKPHLPSWVVKENLHDHRSPAPEELSEAQFEDWLESIEGLFIGHPHHRSSASASSTRSHAAKQKARFVVTGNASTQTTASKSSSSSKAPSKVITTNTRTQTEAPVSKTTGTQTQTIWFGRTPTALPHSPIPLHNGHLEDYYSYSDDE